MAQAKYNGLMFAIFHGERNIGQDELRDPPGRSVIRIAPVIQGSKRAGQLQTIIGVAIIVAASYFSGGAAAGGGSTNLLGSAAGAAVGAFGISLALSGVAQMVASTSNGLGIQDSADNKPSYGFNGPVNTQAQGNPVPLWYGRMIVGGAIISSGIYREDEA